MAITSTLLHLSMIPMSHVIWKPAVASYCDFATYVEYLLIDSLAPLFGSTSHFQNGLLRYLVLSIRRAASVGRVILCRVSCLSCEYFLDGRLPLCFFLPFLGRSFWF